jgi:hypothetical protein
MTGRALRSLLLAAAAFGAMIAVPIDPATLHLVEASADEGAPSVGARLVAVVDVELDQAVVKAGSSVSVVGRKARAGRLMFDVALADGHVVRGVPLRQLQSSFRVA